MNDFDEPVGGRSRKIPAGVEFSNGDVITADTIAELTDGGGDDGQ